LLDKKNTDGHTDPLGYVVGWLPLSMFSFFLCRFAIFSVFTPLF
jgi:hypothetical protein